MESVEKVLQDPVLLDKLKETSEGKIIGAKIISFLEELDTLPESVRNQFSSQFGSRFKHNLNRLVGVESEPEPEAYFELSGGNVVWILVILLAIAGNIC
jgi:hypothetical protein